MSSMNGDASASGDATGDALVIGAGVIGLTAAVRLREAGWRVRVVAAEPPERTCSAVAGAFWYPYRAEPPDRVAAWARRSFAVLREQAETPGTGVHMRAVVEMWRRAMPDPDWADAAPDFRHLHPDETPPGYADGYAFTSPAADMPVHLRWLAGRLAETGVAIETRRFASLADAAAEAPLVVNCTGLGARGLVPDPSLFPIRGQVVVVQNPGVERIVVDEEAPGGLAYVVPRERELVLGGTAEDGAWETEPDPRTAERILRACAELEPGVRGARVLGHAVGLRPGRPTVRLDTEALPGGARCIHCYGHGGAGLTLAWGCAEEIVRLAAAG